MKETGYITKDPMGGIYGINGLVCIMEDIKTMQKHGGKFCILYASVVLYRNNTNKLDNTILDHSKTVSPSVDDVTFNSTPETSHNSTNNTNSVSWVSASNANHGPEYFVNEDRSNLVI